jgi:hypothetical protein
MSGRIKGRTRFMGVMNMSGRIKGRIGIMNRSYRVILIMNPFSFPY